MRERRSGRVLLVLPIAAMLTGCASERQTGAGRAAARNDWRAVLNAAAQRQEDRPDRRAEAAPLPPGLALDALNEADPACASREEAIERYAQPVPAAADAPVEAVRRYVSGRAALARGNAAAAARDLERAAELDPSSPDVLTALGEARLTAGDRLAALGAFRDAFQAGSRAPGMLLLLGLQSQREGDQLGAAQYLGTLLKEAERGGDPAIAPLANVAFGESLLALGHPRAAREALAAGLELPEVWTQQTRFSSEVSALYRSRPILWRLVGDTSLQLGEHDAARAAYARAAEILPSQGWALMERRVGAAMRAGNPAAAVLIVLEDIAEDPRRVRDRHVRLMRHIAGHRAGGDAGLVLSAAAAAREALGDEITPTLASRLVRLEAAASADDEAVDLLAGHLERFPLDPAAAADLAARLPASADVILRLAGPIAAREPGAASLLGEALVERFGIPAAQTPVRNVSGRILLAAWLREAEQIDEARVVAGPLAGTTELESPAALETFGLVAGSHGDWAGVQQAISSLAGDDPARISARATLLAALQRFDEALAEVRTLDVAAASPRRLLEAARLAALAGDAEAMREFLTVSLERDPYLEQTYVALIEAYRGMGDGADERRRQVGARLQTLSPDGKALLLLRSRELMMAGQHGHAFSQVMALAHQAPRDPSARDLALEVSERAVAVDSTQLETALAWLRTAHHWDPAWAVSAEASLRLAAGQVEEAEQLLTGAIAAAPESPRLAGALEAVRRASGGQAEAEELALARLSEAAPTFGNVAQHAAILARRGEADRAIELLDSLPTGSRFVDSQAAALLSGIQPAVQASLQGSLPQEMRTTLNLIRAAKERVTVTPPMHLLHLQLAIALSDSWAASEAIRALEQAGLVRQLAASYGVADEGLPEGAVAAQLCYELAILFAQRGREPDAEAMYRLALTFEPRHGWSCNNLGYDLVERGEDIEEAERLLLIAHEELGSEASVIDSLAWLRYRQGMFEDKLDAASGRIVAGAVSLLEAAVSDREGAQNPTLRDHYGDALWRAGRSAEARNQWNLAIDAAERLRDPRLREAVPPAYIQELTERLGRLRQKVIAASTGQSPAVAPLFPGVSLESRASTENNPGEGRQE